MKLSGTADAPRICGGFTLIEMAVFVVVASALAAIGAWGLSQYGARNKVRGEADRVVTELWDLRSRATVGLRNPCMDFPAADSVRLYSDTSSVPDGYGSGDKPLGGFRFRGGVKALILLGGTGPNHFVCFESRGAMGSAGAALDLTLGVDPANPNQRRVRLLPSTGIAKAL